jgi:hypothetical protein
MLGKQRDAWIESTHACTCVYVMYVDASCMHGPVCVWSGASSSSSVCVYICISFFKEERHESVPISLKKEEVHYIRFNRPENKKLMKLIA